MLNDKMKQSRSTISRDFLTMINSELETLAENVVTKIETWFSLYDPRKGNEKACYGNIPAHQHSQIQGLNAIWYNNEPNVLGCKRNTIT